MIIPGLDHAQSQARPAICKHHSAFACFHACFSNLLRLIGLPSLLALILSLSVYTGAQATKLNAKPLPHAGATSGATGTDADVNEYGRPMKDFAHGKEDTLPSSQWKDRHDYREAAKQEKEEAAQKQKAAADAAKKAQDDRINAIKQYQQISIDANNKGIALGKQGKWAEAIAQHELSLKYDPTNKQFRINLSAAQTQYGEKLLAQKDYAGAANMLRKALVAASDNGQAGKYLNEAIKHMGLDPMLADNRLGIGDQLAAAGDITGANIEYQQAMLLDPSARTYTKMGDMAMRYGQAANAMSWYRQAVVKDSDYGPAHRQLGNSMLAMKDMTGAASELRKAVILDPKDVAAGQLLIDIWRRQVALNPLLAENHLGLATAMQLTGDHTTAQNEYDQVERLDPRNASLAAGRASLQRAVKHTEAERHKEAAETFFNQALYRDALAEIGQAVMIEPRNDKYQFLLGQCLEANGDMQGAKQAYYTAVLNSPKNDEAAQHLRDVENALGLGGSRGGQPPQIQRAEGLRRPDSGSNPNQAGQQPGAMGIAITQGSGQAGAQSFGQTGGEFRKDKNMFEGSPQTTEHQGDFAGHGQTATPQYNNYRTSSNQTSGNQAQSNAFQQKRPDPSNNSATPALNPQIQATITAAANLELQHDFQGAANLLKESLNTNLQNPEIHHRLAVNLLNLGQLEESVSEFRIASALSPGSKVFMEDYARALKIHKKALQSDDSGQSTGAGPTTGAVGDLK